MQDFLTFETFITPTLLIFIYYIGVILIPIVSWYLASWIKKTYFSDIYEKMKEQIRTYTTSKQRLYMTIAFLFCFLCMELFWRVMFEFFIAYFDIHDALMKLT